MKKLLLMIMITCLFVPFTIKAESTIIYSESIDSIDGERFEDYLVYYSDKGLDVSGANVWGYEVAVDQNNVVVESATNVKMPDGGFILSAHGTKKVGLMEVEIGDIVEVDLVAKTAEIFRDPIESSYLRSLSNKDKATENYNVAVDNYLTFDRSTVEYEINKIDLAFQELEGLYQSAEIDATMETQIVTLAYEIQERTAKVTYMTTKTRTIEVRAIWHRPNATDIKEDTLQGVIRLLDRFEELGFNAIYLESFWNGFVSGRSELLDTHPNLSSFTYGEEYGNDYLKAFITEANKRNIDVHAWVHTFNAGNSTYLSSSVKSEWLVENYQGFTLHPNAYGGSYYLDPSNQEVLDFVLEMLEEMVNKYDFTGIQLDYIRYYDNNFSNLSEIRDSGYNVNANELFLNAYDLDGDVRTLIVDPNYRSKWFEWRQNNITNAVKYFVNNLREINPEIIISADVVGDISSARNTYMQDWLTWVRNGYIDLLCPMIYTSSNSRLDSVSETVFNQLENNAFLSSGIAAIYQGDSVEKQLEQVVITAKRGGTAIFASQNVIGDSGAEKSLKDGVYRNEAVSPFSNMKEIVDLVIDSLSDLVSNNLSDPTIKKMFLDHFDDISNMPLGNPGEYQEVYEKVNFVRTITPYIADDILSHLVNEELGSLEHVLDVRITRELIILGHYNPEVDETRLDPRSLEYDEENNDDGGNGDNGGETTTTTTENQETDSSSDEVMEDDGDDDNLNIVQIIVPIIFLFTTILLVIVNKTITRRKI